MAPRRKFINRIINSLSEADGLFAEKAALLAPGELACRAGCFGCCVGLFAISLPEALAVRAAVQELGEKERALVLARAERAAEGSAASFPGDAAAGVLDPERREADEDAWFLAVKDVACPALDPSSGRCTVYAARPTTCRTYGLALGEGDALLLPECQLNLPGAPPARVLETAIEASRLAAVDQRLLEIASAAGLPAGVETTVAHAVTGSAFEALERASRG